MVLTDEQQIVVAEAVKFWDNPNQQIFQYAGYPGTGKTFILYEIIKALNIDLNKIAPMAYIGQAAINMRLNGLTNARTIHSWLYTFEDVYKRDADGNVIMDPYFNRPVFTKEFRYNPHAFDNIDLIIIDEAGSVPYSLKEDIERSGTKIIVTGDLGQLPPPCDRPAYLNQGQIFRLTKIMRQKDSEDNGILQLAELAKRGERIKYGKYGNNCIVIPESALTIGMLANADIFICGTNKTRDKYNKIIREKVFNRTSKLPQNGDVLVCRQNNWSIESNGINLANGLRGIVLNHPDMTLFLTDRFYIDFEPDRLPGCKFNNIECDYNYLIADYETRKKLKSFAYDTGNKFEYGYAITTHMAQGAQYNQGIYFAEYFGDLTNKLNFTGITRFKNKLIYVIKQ